MEVVDNRKNGVFDKVRDSNILKKLKGIKNIQLIAAVFIIAIALIIYSSVMNKKDSGASADKGQTASSTLMDDEETKLASILGGIDGAGKVETMITRKGEEIVGILVVAEGANNISVMLKLQTATTTVMGVDKSIVDIFVMK